MVRCHRSPALANTNSRLRRQRSRRRYTRQSMSTFRNSHCGRIPAGSMTLTSLYRRNQYRGCWKAGKSRHRRVRYSISGGISLPVPISLSPPFSDFSHSSMTSIFLLSYSTLPPPSIKRFTTIARVIATQECSWCLPQHRCNMPSLFLLMLSLFDATKSATLQFCIHRPLHTSRREILYRAW
jgi:hypothetical protein